VNSRRSENCIFRIYGSQVSCRCLTRVSKDSPWRYKAVYLKCIIEIDVKVNIMRFRTLRSIKFQGLCRKKLEFITVWKLYFYNLRSIGFLSIPYSSIKIQSMNIQSSLFQVHNRKRLTWKLILCCFEHCVFLNFKASAAETGIFHGLEFVFFQSTVHRLSVDSLLVYQKTVHEDTKQFISSA
jgi:hypothetical protein